MEKCVESLVIGGDEVEVLVVNDGSSDNTAEIADKLEQKYPGIVRAIHQQNKGHGGAVNTGLMNATGLYFKVVDSDDKVKASAYLTILDTLRKNGRLSNFKAIVATALKIKPICTSTPEGEIQQVGQARGINKALVKMVEMAADSVGNMSDNEIAVSHVNNPERGQMVLDAIRERTNAKHYFMENGWGCTSMYSNDGGIILVL